MGDHTVGGATRFKQLLLIHSDTAAKRQRVRVGEKRRGQQEEKLQTGEGRTMKEKDDGRRGGKGPEDK